MLDRDKCFEEKSVCGERDAVFQIGWSEGTFQGGFL